VKKKKVKLAVYALRHIEGVKVYLNLFLSSALDGGEWLAWRLSLFSPGKESPVSTGQEAVSAWGPVWTYSRSPAPAGIRTPDHPAHSLVTVQNMWSQILPLRLLFT